MIRWQLKLWFLKFRANYLAYLWRIGIIRRATAFRWEVDVAVYPGRNEV